MRWHNCAAHHLPCTGPRTGKTATVGQVALKLKTLWRDGTTHLVMSPLEFMQRMAALVHRPRRHLIRFHDVLARATASRRPIHDGECRQSFDPCLPPNRLYAVSCGTRQPHLTVEAALNG